MENRKTISMTIDPQAHKRLKKRARQMGLSAGRMVENMLASLEFRLTGAFIAAGVNYNESEYVQPLVAALWAADQNAMTDKELRKRCREIGSQATAEDDSWQPYISLAEDSGPLTEPEEKNK